MSRNLVQIAHQDGKIWVSPDSSYALSAIIPDKLRVGELTPIPVMKAIKNPVEIQGMNFIAQLCLLMLIGKVINWYLY
jgi:hypothetical protein